MHQAVDDIETTCMCKHGRRSQERFVGMLARLTGTGSKALVLATSELKFAIPRR